MKKQTIGLILDILILIIGLFVGSYVSNTFFGGNRWVRIGIYVVFVAAGLLVFNAFKKKDEKNDSEKK